MVSAQDQHKHKSRHKEYSLVFPIIALIVLMLWGNSSNFGFVIGQRL
jgi:Ca2+:H+ antiporter